MNKCCGDNQTSETESVSSCTSSAKKITSCSHPTFEVSQASQTSAVKAETSCCGQDAEAINQNNASCCPTNNQNRIDWLLWGSAIFVSITYLIYLTQDISPFTLPIWLITMADTSFEMFNAMWWGVILGVVLVGWLNRIPREMIISVLGKGHTKKGIFRATLAGVLLDLCNHGILMVAMKLYERGASLGQVMAFLIASPWNSFTLTLILIGLVGLKLTLLFIVFSMLIAWLSGFIFDLLEAKGKLPLNPNMLDIAQDYQLSTEFKQLTRNADYSLKSIYHLILDGLSGAVMVIRWILFGVVMVCLIRAFVPMDVFQTWFGASAAGLLLTLVAATIIEVCSEGSTPIAADLVNRANAPGNAFTFLMAGASTDYTEIMAIKDTMKSWKIALFLPLVTVPQILLLAWLLNQYA